MDDTISLGMSLMPTANMTAGIAHTYTGLALEPDLWILGALQELRRTVNDDVVAAPELQQRIWSRIITEIEADEIAGFKRLAQTAS